MTYFVIKKKKIRFQIDQWKHPDKFIRCLCHTCSCNDNVSVYCNLYCNRYKIRKNKPVFRNMIHLYCFRFLFDHFYFRCRANNAFICRTEHNKE